MAAISVSAGLKVHQLLVAGPDTLRLPHFLCTAGWDPSPDALPEPALLRVGEERLKSSHHSPQKPPANGWQEQECTYPSSLIPQATKLCSSCSTEAPVGLSPLCPPQPPNHECTLDRLPPSLSCSLTPPGASWCYLPHELFAFQILSPGYLLFLLPLSSFLLLPLLLLFSALSLFLKNALFQNNFIFFYYFYLFIFDHAGSSLLPTGFLPLWHTGLVALQHMGSFRTRGRTRVPCIW